MTNPPANRLRRLTAWTLVLLTLASPSGCMNTIQNAVPVRRLPPHLQTPKRSEMQEVDLAALRRTPVAHKLIASGDTLGIHVQDVLGPEDQQPQVYFATNRNDPGAPAVGTPIMVDAEGFITLPMIPPVRAADKTLDELKEQIRAAYQKAQILQPDRDRVVVTMMKPKTHHVLVVREDTGGDTPSLIAQKTILVSRRGSAQILEMPNYENDLLHALSQTSGLPGQDGENEVLILRGSKDESWDAVLDRLNEGADPLTLKRTVVRVPLRIPPGMPVPFNERDITLADGDVVYVPSRERDFFYASGLLPTGPFPLPRDYDLDIIGAINMASGAVASPAGYNAVAFSFRNGPGNIVPPSRVIVIRTMPNGKQFKIYCNLRRALDDPRERLRIQRGDVVLLQYTPFELATLIGINFISFSFPIPNGQ
jgi:hypothetical protein